MKLMLLLYLLTVSLLLVIQFLLPLLLNVVVDDAFDVDVTGFFC